MQFFSCEIAHDIFCMAKATPENTARVGRNSGGYLVYRSSSGDPKPHDDEMVVELESEAAAYLYLDMLKARPIPIGEY